MDAKKELGKELSRLSAEHIRAIKSFQKEKYQECADSLAVLAHCIDSARSLIIDVIAQDA